MDDLSVLSHLVDKKLSLGRFDPWKRKLYPRFSLEFFFLVSDPQNTKTYSFQHEMLSKYNRQ